MTKDQTRAQDFQLKGSEYIELKNLLKVSGLLKSGGAAKSVIEEGLVLVDGQVETRKACKIKSGQKVTFKEQTILVQK